MSLSKQQRKELLRVIKNASGIAQYALDAKMTDEQLLDASQHLDILALIKSANTYNRYRQGKNTQKVNEQLTEVKTELTETQAKLQQFLDPNNSEILQAGRWLANALSLNGRGRRQALLERELVHKEDYNNDVSDMRVTIETIVSASEEMEGEAEETIEDLQRRIDTLRQQMSQVQDYISHNYGHDQWRMISNTFRIQ